MSCSRRIILVYFIFLSRGLKWIILLYYIFFSLASFSFIFNDQNRGIHKQRKIIDYETVFCVSYGQFVRRKATFRRSRRRSTTFQYKSRFLNEAKPFTDLRKRKFHSIRTVIFAYQYVISSRLFLRNICTSYLDLGCGRTDSKTRCLVWARSTEKLGAGIL